MQLGPKILVVGAGSPNADMVAEVLRSEGVDAEWTAEVKHPSFRRIMMADAVYGIYLQTCSRYIVAAKLLGKKTIVHFVGSDAYWVNRERSFWRRKYWRFVLDHCDLIFYVSPHLEALVGRKGVVLPFPISTGAFRDAKQTPSTPDRDVLYYCPSGEANEKIYCLTWIVNYADEHPNEKITIIGNSSHPANYQLGRPNVEIIPYVERSQMPALYKRHKTLIRMTTEDGLARMIHEAVLCGLKVIYNGKEVTEVPPAREPHQFATAFKQAVSTISPNRFNAPDQRRRNR
jgi:hypothetical protein